MCKLYHGTHRFQCEMQYSLISSMQINRWPNSSLPLFPLKINGVKDNDLLINELLDNNIVFLQEHLISKVNIDRPILPS